MSEAVKRQWRTAHDSYIVVNRAPTSDCVGDHQHRRSAVQPQSSPKSQPQTPNRDMPFYRNNILGRKVTQSRSERRTESCSTSLRLISYSLIDPWILGNTTAAATIYAPWPEAQNGCRYETRRIRAGGWLVMVQGKWSFRCRCRGVCAGNRMAPSMNTARTRRGMKPTAVRFLFIYDASVALWLRER
jgi:hypothetical protein